ncbi:MAG: phosphotransferase, partial [Myxococcota bacterium]
PTEQTQRLIARGVPSPSLVRTTDGRLWVEYEGGAWRMLTWMDGQVHDKVTDPDLAREAGALLGRFHVALRDFEYAFKSRRLGVHDTPKHLANLEQALDTERSCGAYDDVAPVGQAILNAAAELESLPPTPQRIVHGDPKVTNMIFDDGGRGHCMIDLDTLAPMALPLEMGDALRSWCNPGGEDDAEAIFDAKLFAAAIDGYAHQTGDWLTPQERESLFLGARTVAIELAARFAADALLDCYFGWNKQKYPSRSAHNLVRARSQLQLARSMAEQAPVAERAVRAAWSA